MAWCPECGAEYQPGIVACPRCRVVLGAKPSVLQEPTVVQRVPDAAAGALLQGILELHGIRAVLRSAVLPAYGSVRRDWSTSAWGEILVGPDDVEDARAVIADYLLALERGGQVRDEDVEDREGRG